MTTLRDNTKPPFHEDFTSREAGDGSSLPQEASMDWGSSYTYMDESWIKLHRKLLDHWVYTRPEYLSIWLFLLMRANWKPSKAVVQGRIQTIDRGEVLTSIRALAEGTHTTDQTVRTFLKLAKQDAMIDVIANTAATHIKLLNYNRLQDLEKNDQHTLNERSTNGQRTPNNIIRREEVKKGKKEDSSASHRARPLDHSDAVAYFAELGMSADEAQRFTDYYTANGWKVGRNPMKDWKAAARNWRKGWQDKQSKQGDTSARTAPQGLPAQVIEIANRPKLSSEAVEAFKEVYMSKVLSDE